MAKKAFVIGANGEYLNYAVSGAERVSAILKEAGYDIFPESQQTSKLDPYNFLHIFSEMVIDSAQADDTIIFYFSGHGTINNNNNSSLHLLLNSSEINKLSSYLNFSFIADCLSCCPSEKKLVILDCCEAVDAKFDDKREDNYAFIRPTRSYQKAKEINSLQSTFLTYYLCKSLSENQENPILLSTLRSKLQKAVDEHNQSNPNEKSDIFVSERGYKDFEIVPQKNNISIFISYNYENLSIKNFAKELSKLLNKNGFNAFLRTDSDIEDLKENQGNLLKPIRKADILLFIIEYEDANILKKHTEDDLWHYKQNKVFLMR